MQSHKALFLSLMIFANAARPAGSQPTGSAETLNDIPASCAKQAVAVGRSHFYAIDNAAICKHDKKTGLLVSKWENPDGWAIHFNSGVVVGNKLYLAHSNYPALPMVSSVEIFDVETLNHIGSHSLETGRGSLTWIDRDAGGRWWGAFGNYDKVMEGRTEPYGGTRNTRIVRFDKNWQVEESFTLPETLLARFGVNTNSGGSWGPDGRLYITGHNNAEIYVLEEPKGGSEMRWITTVAADITGQGIDWDNGTTLYGIKRRNQDNSVTVHSMPRIP